MAFLVGSGSGSGSGKNVPAPAAPAPAPMLKFSYESEPAIRFLMSNIKRRPLTDLTLSLNFSLNECL